MMSEDDLRLLKLKILEAHMLAACTEELCQRIADEMVPFRCAQLVRGVTRSALEKLDDWERDDAKPAGSEPRSRVEREKAR